MRTLSDVKVHTLLTRICLYFHRLRMMNQVQNLAPRGILTGTGECTL
jgi:hypothetical protein